MTLIQTKRIKPFPVLLMKSAFWGGLIDWFKETLIKEGTISPSDLDLFTVVETPEEAVDIIKRIVIV
jgi:predicted Rossmann-fold nucleotide-binding protein